MEGTIDDGELEVNVGRIQMTPNPHIHVRLSHLNDCAVVFIFFHQGFLDQYLGITQSSSSAYAQYLHNISLISLSSS